MGQLRRLVNMVVPWQALHVDAELTQGDGRNRGAENAKSQGLMAQISDS